MLYEVGTRIDLSHLNGKPEAAAVPEIVPDRRTRQYDAGTRILFVKVMEGLTQAVVITPRGSVALA